MESKTEGLRRVVEDGEGDKALRDEIETLRTEIQDLRARVETVEREAEEAQNNNAEEVFRLVAGKGIDVQPVDGTWVVSAIPQYRYIPMNWLDGCFAPDEEEGE